jgi:antirestriction protein ArdC
MSENYPKKSNYEQYQDYAGEIAEIFLKALENDNLRFTKSWSAGEIQADKPHNPITKTVYKGLNSFTLDITKDEMNYSSNSWLTFNQIKELGGYVKRGSKSMPISFFTTTKKVKEFDEQTGEEIEVIKKLDTPVFKKASVFNIDQVDGIDKEKIQEIIRSGYNKLDTFNNIAVCEAILQNVDLPIHHLEGAGRAYYRPSTDSIHLPSKEQFKSEEAYYSVAFHELGHATGHEKRLGRDLSGEFGSSDYAKEELKAEIYSYLQAKELGIAYNLENHQSYVKSWAKNLTNNKMEIIQAVKDAMKMVKYVNEHYVNKDNVKEVMEKTLNQEKSFEVSGAIARSFTKSSLNEDEQEKKEDWEILKNNIPQTKALLKDYIKQSEEELKETKDFKEISNIKKDIQGYKKVIESLEKIEASKGKNIQVNQTIISSQNQVNTKKEEIEKISYVQIPMHDIIKNAGFDIKRDKSSSRQIVVSDGKDTLIISRGKGKADEKGEIKGEGNYVYFNSNHDKNDKGTIYNFCRARGIDINELVKNANIKEINHTLTISNSNEYNPKLAEKYKDLKTYNASNENSLTKIRKIKPAIVENFSSIKIDEYKNVIFPSYTVEETSMKIKDMEKAVSFLTISGMNKKLLNKPLTHDKEGNKYEKPINSLEEGKSGLSILIKDGIESKDITHIVTGENSIDNLSYAELKNIDLNKTAFASFNGSMKDEALKAFTFLLEKTLPNVEKITMAYDNDECGFKYDKKLTTVIHEKSKDLKKSFEIQTDKPKTKDWNDDLKQHKQKLMTSRSNSLSKGRENENNFV